MLIPNRTPGDLLANLGALALGIICFLAKLTISGAVALAIAVALIEAGKAVGSFL